MYQHRRRWWLDAVRALDAHDEATEWRTPTQADRLRREALVADVRRLELALADAPTCGVCGEYCSSMLY